LLVTVPALQTILGKKQGRQFTYNITLGRVRVTIFAVESH